MEYIAETNEYLYRISDILDKLKIIYQNKSLDDLKLKRILDINKQISSIHSEIKAILISLDNLNNNDIFNDNTSQSQRFNLIKKCELIKSTFDYDIFPSLQQLAGDMLKEEEDQDLEDKSIIKSENKSKIITDAKKYLKESATHIDFLTKATLLVNSILTIMSKSVI